MIGTFRHWFQSMNAGARASAKRLPNMLRNTMATGHPLLSKHPTKQKLRSNSASVDPGTSLDTLLSLPPAQLQKTLKGKRWESTEPLLETLTKVLLNDPNWRRSPPRVKRHFQRTAMNIRAHDVVGKRVLDFGCGHSNPLGASLLFYLNGAASCQATDLLPADDDTIAKGLYYLVQWCATHPGEFLFWDTNLQDFLDRLLMIDTASLRDGDWKSALSKIPITHLVTGHDRYIEEIGQVDLVVSQSVLEHVSPFGPVMASLANLISSNGLMVHYVDFNDHDRKANKHDDLARWRFLTTNHSRGASHSNRIRLSQMIEHLQSAGFAVEVASTVECPPPADLRPLLLDQFKRLTDADLQVVAAMIVARPQTHQP